MFPPNEDNKMPSMAKKNQEDKIKPPFSTIHAHIPECCKKMSPLAEVEWTKVKTPVDAKAWHLKWTPWLLPECIDGIIEYYYKKLLIKNTKGEDVIKLLPDKSHALTECPTNGCEICNKKFKEGI
jgi:hypothetical protein